MFEQLQSIIQSEIQELSDALSLEKKKREAILSVSGKQLRDFTSEQEKAEKRMKQLEDERFAAMETIRATYLPGLGSVRDIRFSTLVQAAQKKDPSLGDSFHKLLEQFRLVAESLQNEIAANQDLIRKSNEYIEKTILSLKDSTDQLEPLYGPAHKNGSAASRDELDPPAGNSRSGKQAGQSLFLNANA